MGGCVGGSSVFVSSALATHKSRKPEMTPLEATPDYRVADLSPAPVRPSLAHVGSELPFPFDIREITGDPPPHDLPKVLNYWFTTTRLVANILLAVLQREFAA